jgi:steroid delta-isomerase-like uncharacterized protein
MGVKENKELVKHVTELWNPSDIKAFYELLAPEYVEHLNIGEATLEKVKQFYAILFTAFPDINATIEEMVAEGDKVAYREVVKGTHQGEFMGIPPTGRKIEMTNTVIFRIADGKIAESWATMDLLSLMQQVGIVPKMF